MAANLVSQPPLMVPVTDQNGNLNRAWSSWFRDVYRRVAYKGGNAIDDNLIIIEGTINTLDDTIAQVLVNVFNIAANAAALVAHEALTTAHGSNGEIVGFDDLATELLQGLVKRMALVANASASTVAVVAADATVSAVSVTSADATISTVAVVAADVAAAPVAYDQTYTDTIVALVNELKADVNQLVTDVNPSATLANEIKADVNQMVTDVNPSATLSNELKADVNTLVTDINASITQLNALLANSKTSGQMTT